MSVRGLIGLTDPVPSKRISHLTVFKMLLLGLDLSHCVKGVRVSNSPLDLKQFSFTHIIQVLGLPTLINGFSVGPFSGMLLSRTGFPFRLAG